MANGVYIPMSAAVAASTQLDIVANNLANVDTAGYKGLRSTFSEHLVSARDGAPSSKGFTALDSTTVDMQQGRLKATGNPTDLAIEGTGFFMVRSPQGDLLTRSGALHLSSDGTLVDPSGNPILSGTTGEAASPIRVAPNGGPISIAPSGEVEQAGTIVARIMVVDPGNAKLQPMGDAHFALPPEGVQRLEDPRVLSGFVESSNINPIRGMVELIETTRSYESAQRVMRQYRQVDRKTLEST